MRIVKVSLHNHLRTSSYITKETADKAVKIASQRLGKGGILGVINFNPSADEIDPRWNLFVEKLNYDKIDTRNGVYLPELDLLAVRGQEVPTEEGYHVLLVGTTKHQNITNEIKLSEVLIKGKEFEADITADHPFHKHGVGNFLKINPEYYSAFNGYEVYNGICALSFGKYNRANRKAQDEFDRIKEEYPNLTQRIGDDGHSVYEIGRSYSNILMPNNYTRFKDSPEDVVEAVQYGYIINREDALGDMRRASRIGATDHAIDLIVLISAGKALKWHPNNKTAPLLNRLGINI